MAAGRLYRPKAKSFWILVRRLLLRRNRKPAAAGGDEDDRKEEKSGLLSRSSLEQLLVTDAGGGPGDSDVVCRSAKKHGQPGVPRPEVAAAVSPAAAGVGGRDGAAGVHRRFVFGGFRRRLLMRRPWRPVLVAIPE
ncbi:hypothetical protein HU200_055406 [Digitaria exilis]|uniref:Uncharacterized protein n=1 Tax=Digitaria exilis TaxID=1010633 RepID=A0A835AI16_9POAL|nr:hypothetical protein HU200_055406 [Digitaria exilis]CAB3472309.1 unnamed protein product [Digitaria exilis]